jgi:hypothetical protein
MSVVSVVCCQLQVSATGRSLVQGSGAECGVFECEPGTLKRPPRLTRTVDP